MFSYIKHTDLKAKSTILTIRHSFLGKNSINKCEVPCCMRFIIYILL